MPAVLPELTDHDLCEIGVSLGQRRLLVRAIRALADEQGGHSPTEGARLIPQLTTEPSGAS